jgi:hypothetical protein
MVAKNDPRGFAFGAAGYTFEMFIVGDSSYRPSSSAFY